MVTLVISLRVCVTIQNDSFDHSIINASTNHHISLKEIIITILNSRTGYIRTQNVVYYFFVKSADYSYLVSTANDMITCLLVLVLEQSLPDHSTREIEATIAS